MKRPIRQTLPEPVPSPWDRQTHQLCGWRVSVLSRRVVAPGGKAPVVLLHGLVAEAETFRKLIDLLPDDRDYYAVDVVGAGFSERPVAGDVSFQGIAAVIGEFVRRVGLERPILLGHSHGGAVALTVAVGGTVDVGGLVLLCPAHPFSGHEKWLVRFYLTRLGRLFAHSLPHIPAWLLLVGFQRMPGSRSALVADDFAPYVHTLRGPGTIRHILRLLKSWAGDMRALEDRLRARPLATPTLLVWGARDVVVPVTTAEALMERLPQSSLVSLEGVGHLPNEESPKECAAAIAQWMGRL